jgi:hypothetical protein
MASTAYAPPAFKSIAELVGARAHTTLIGQAPGPHGTSVRPRDTGLEASAAGHAGEGMATTSSRWGEASVRVLLTHPTTSSTAHSPHQLDRHSSSPPLARPEASRTALMAPCTGSADHIELEIVFLQQAVEHTPGERTKGTATLQCER